MPKGLAVKSTEYSRLALWRTLPPETGEDRVPGVVSLPTRPFPRQRVAAQYEALAPIYDELLGERFFPHLRRTFEQIERQYALRFSCAVDVGCGTGTFVAYLRARGVDPVWGVDRSLGMLAQAAVKNARNGARFLHQDLRSLRLPHRVDLLTCQFDTLNYLLTPADLRTALVAFCRALQPGGHALFDVVTPRTFKPGHLHRLELAHSIGRRVTRRTRYLRRRMQVAQIRVSGLSDDRCETHLQRAYTVAEVVAALAGTGLRLRAVHDFYRPSAPADGAERAIFLARADSARSLGRCRTWAL
jgi:SAM-dependent methyltransferase